MTSGVKRQPLLNSYWTNGFLPSRHQGVLFRSQGDPVMFLKSPDGTDRATREKQLELINWMNSRRFQVLNDPEIMTRVKQYELAFRMQTEVPDLVDLRDETEDTLSLYGVDRQQPSFAKNCLLARRMVEQGVRFVQLYDAALIKDLRDRGLLDETLVIWGGEFGRTPVAQGEGDKWGRDHHPHGFTMWMAGGGIRGGVSYGATDEFGFHAEVNRLDVHDVHATILHCLGVDHEQLVYRHQGRDFRLTDVAGRVIPDLLM
jgi:hypothetical protein